MRVLATTATSTATAAAPLAWTVRIIIVVVGRATPTVLVLATLARGDCRRHRAFLARRAFEKHEELERVVDEVGDQIGG